MRRATRRYVAIAMLLSACCSVGLAAAQPAGDTPPQPANDTAAKEAAREADARAKLLAAFAEMKKGALEARKDVFRDAAGKAAEAPKISAQDRGAGRLTTVSVVTPALAQEAAVNSVERASAALKTSVDGAEAGISVAPLALLGLSDQPHQINVTLAALKEDKTRLGLAYSVEAPWSPESFDDLGLEACKFDEDKAAQKIDELRVAYVQVCEGLVGPLLAAHPKLTSATFAEEACALSGAKYAPLADALRAIARIVKEGSTRLAEAEKTEGVKAASARFAFEEKVLALKPALTTLDTYRPQKPDECHDADAIRDAARRVAATRRRHRFGVGGTVDLFPMVFGFQPGEDEDLPRGDLSRMQARIEYQTLSAASSDLTLGVGLARSRDALADPLESYFTPSISFGVVLGSLTGAPLRQPQGELFLIDGNLPPRLSAGVELTADISLDRPDTQPTTLHAFKSTFFLDFRFNKDLAFRLGVPVTATTVKRKAADATDTEPAVEAKRDLQWSVPIALTTVLKL